MSIPSPATAPLPVLFVSHGSPMFALEAGSSGPALGQWAAELTAARPQRLRGIVLMSPHWTAPAAQVMTGAQPTTWHDFGGFPRPLYDLQYPALGAPDLAAQVLDLLQASGLAATANDKRPFDHGAWVPLLHLFPNADVPLVQVALPADAGPAEVYALGAALSSLREQGVLVIGSGSMTHNLSEFFGGAREPAPYVVAFSRWVEDAVLRGHRAALFDYRRQAPSAERAHPSDDHFLPIFFALGAAGWGGDAEVKVDYLTREVMYGMLAMDSFALM